mgnify:CR=1 FL=1
MAKKEIKEKKNKKNSSYFKDMKAELKKVVWPTPKELLNNTIAVIVFVLIIAVIVFVLDLCFDNLNKYGITKLQEAVQSSFQSEDENTTTDENTSEAEGETDANTTENEVENSSEGETTEIESEEQKLNENEDQANTAETEGEATESEQ